MSIRIILDQSWVMIVSCIPRQTLWHLSVTLTLKREAADSTKTLVIFSRFNNEFFLKGLNIFKNLECLLFLNYIECQTSSNKASHPQQTVAHSLFLSLSESMGVAHNESCTWHVLFKILSISLSLLSSAPPNSPLTNIKNSIYLLW